MTQMELADRLNSSFEAVSNWERRPSTPDNSLLPELATRFAPSPASPIAYKLTGRSYHYFAVADAHFHLVALYAEPCKILRRYLHPPVPVEYGEFLVL